MPNHSRFILLDAASPGFDVARPKESIGDERVEWPRRMLAEQSF
jgi:hypothetical protein